MRGFAFSFTFGAEDTTLGRWATSTWGGESSVPPPLGNDPQPKSDEYYGGVAEGRGSSAAFVQGGDAAFGSLVSFGQFSMSGDGSIFEQYDAGFGDQSDFVHYQPAKKHLLPILHVGP